MNDSSKEAVMSRSLLAVPVLLLLVSLTGCQAKKDDMITMQYPEEQKKIERIVHEIFDAAKQKDFDKLESFHLKGPKFTKFDDWFLTGFGSEFGSAGLQGRHLWRCGDSDIRCQLQHEGGTRSGVYESAVNVGVRERWQCVEDHT
jgi:hypothetical protein